MGSRIRFYQFSNYQFSRLRIIIFKRENNSNSTSKHETNFAPKSYLYCSIVQIIQIICASVQGIQRLTQCGIAELFKFKNILGRAGWIKRKMPFSLLIFILSISVGLKFDFAPAVNFSRIPGTTSALCHDRKVSHFHMKSTGSFPSIIFNF